jgi:hypothetical protein
VTQQRHGPRSRSIDQGSNVVHQVFYGVVLHTSWAAAFAIAAPVWRPDTITAISKSDHLFPPTQSHFWESMKAKSKLVSGAAGQNFKLQPLAFTISVLSS